MKVLYTKYQREYLRKRYRKYSFKVLAEMFNANFGTNKTAHAIKDYCRRQGFHKTNGDGRFQEGHKAWQNGMTTEEYKSHFTEESYARATADTLPHNSKYKVGDRCDYKINGVYRPCIVISDEPNVPFKERIIQEDRKVYEDAHGKIDRDTKIIHLDGDYHNCDISNLVAVSDYEHLILAQNGWTGNADLVRCGIAYAKLKTLLKGARA